MWSCSREPVFQPLNACSGSEFGLQLQPQQSHATPEGLCQAYNYSLPVFTITFLVAFLPLGLFYNLSLVFVNLHHRASMAALDIYFVSLALANLLQLLVAVGQMLGTELLWHRQGLGEGSELPSVQTQLPTCLTLFVIFSISALAGAYSLALLSLDASLAAALPRNPMVSAHNARHLCSFVWGGALLAVFPAFLLFACRAEPTDSEDGGGGSAYDNANNGDQMLDCQRLQIRRLVDAVDFFAGFLVPLLGVAVSFMLACRIHRRPLRPERPPGPHNRSLEEDEEEAAEAATFRLVRLTVVAHFSLWTLYYVLLLFYLITAHDDKEVAEWLSTRPGLHRTLRGLALLMAYSSSCVTPIIYRCLRINFSSKLDNTLSALHCCPWRRWSGHALERNRAEVL
ncbi:G-protein coupled receptor 146-like [Lampetra fluviatilis]